MSYFYTPAELHQRVGAAFLDTLFLLLTLTPLWLGAGHVTGEEWLFLGSPVLLAALLAAQGTLLTLRGQTLGKRMLKIAVVGRNGGRAGFYRAVFLREVLFWLAVLVPVAGQVFLVMNAVSLIRPYSRSLRDKMSDTLVVQSWE